MRRCKDDWVNATQILKCCNFPKAKRTKILEKGVQQGMHEKIQGGYGRFQGTWIPLPDALRLAQTYGLAPELAPVLYADFANLTIPRKTKNTGGSLLDKDGTPVKRKYIKKAKKDDTTPSKKLKPDLHQQPSFDYGEFRPAPSHPPMGGFVPQNYQQDYQMPNYTSHNQAIQNEFHNYQMQYQRLQQMPQQPQQPAPYYNIPQGDNMMPQPQMMGHFRHNAKLTSSLQSTNETQWLHDEHKESDTLISSTELQFKKHKRDEDLYASQLLRFFSEENSPIPYFIHNPPYDFNINEAIDDEGHTPLHWAASIGNYTMIHLLIGKGANPLVVNNFGLNPLLKLISFNNCFELLNFPKVLDDLELCLINTDINGRTPLHYLCQFAKVKSKFESLSYYLDIIVAKLRQLSEQNNSLVNLLKNVLDHQDVNGDTCLHLASRAGCSKLVRSLLTYGARDDLVNVNNETAKMIIINFNLLYVEKRPEVSTPVQAKNSTANTPDTQRTTVQDDDLEDDAMHTFIKSDSLDDNKENIFIDDSFKSIDQVLTPKLASHQPLAVITERTVESTPVRVEKQDLHKALKPVIVVDELPAEDQPKLAMKDLLSMMNGMINSLGDSYTIEVKHLNQELKRIKKTIAEKHQLRHTSEDKLKTLFEKHGIAITSLDDSHEVVEKEEHSLKQQLQHKELVFFTTLERKLAKELESAIREVADTSEAGSADGAVELTRLQLQRSRLIHQLVARTKNYGMDVNMYKYRKLISLSCGLRVEDIDGLIDGIEESLMETS